MKTLKYIVSSVAVLAVLASCNRKETFQHESFVTFAATSYTVNEDAGTVAVPVKVYNAGSEEVTVTVKAVDGTAKSGTNYEIVEPVSGVLNFAPGETEKSVVVLVKNLKDRFTGNLGFTLSLTSATDGFAEGAINNVAFTINDNDHPLAKFFGTWTGTNPGSNSNGTSKYKMNVVISPVEGDETYRKLLLTDLEPFFAANGFAYSNSTSEVTYNCFTAVVNDNFTEMTISAKQPIGYEDNGDAAYIANASVGDIVITIDQDGSLVIPPYASFIDDSSDGNTYYFVQYTEGCTLTKK